MAVWFKGWGKSLPPNTCICVHHKPVRLHKSLSLAAHPIEASSFLFKIHILLLNVTSWTYNEFILPRIIKIIWKESQRPQVQTSKYFYCDFYNEHINTFVIKSKIFTHWKKGDSLKWKEGNFPGLVVKTPPFRHRALGLIPSQGTRCHMPQLNTKTWCSQINKYLNWEETFQFAI